ncbi:MAG: hypothetical protein NVS2B4_18590 [Ramlibacter sp.]
MMQETDTLARKQDARALGGAFERVSRALAARFGLRASDRLEEPFRDSDFEADSGFLGRPFGDH